MQYPVIIAVLVLIVIIFYWRRSKGGKKSKKKKSKTSKKTRPGVDAEVEEDLDEIEDARSKNVDVEERDDIMQDARQLYDLAHEDLANGMQLQDFEDQVGDLAGDEPSEVFIELKQLYTEAMDNNKDPLKAVTLKDYASILEHS